MTEDQRAQYVSELFKNPAFEEAFALMREAMVRESLNCAVSDDIGRFRYSIAIKTIDWVMNRLKGILIAGQINDAEAQELQKQPWWKLPAEQRAFPTF
jgi:hypothetical protein